MPWTRMRYRNGKVWIETDDQGQVLVAITRTVQQQWSRVRAVTL